MRETAPLLYAVYDSSLYQAVRAAVTHHVPTARGTGSVTRERYARE
nr:MAG TPA: hypothetical protein [Caudoviricetes sp.]